MSDYFSDGRSVETIATKDVVAWVQGTGAGHLLLPPIQRSVVWTNSQVINYWDSVLRGYPAGLMLVHRSRPQARTFDGQTIATCAHDFDLFDGQQRLTALLLGYNAGQLRTRLKLWVDLGAQTSADSGLLFQLRVNSAGQPFGYRADSPNDKPTLGQRSAKQAEWKESRGVGTFRSEQAFRDVTGQDLIASQCAYPLHFAVSLVSAGEQHAVETLLRECPGAEHNRIVTFVRALATALQCPIIFQLVDSTIIEQEKDYIRYFGRLGQGGTRLSNDELTYSIIKHQYPEVSDRMKEIMEGPSGRIASEVNLVLAALRTAKVISGWDGGGAEWKIIGRPYPDFVSELKQLPLILAEFQQMIPNTTGGRLKVWLEAIRTRLEYKPVSDANANPAGLPVMLLARLPHSLVDVLLLLQSQEEKAPKKPANEDLLPPFVLYWLLFVSDSDKAASLVFQRHYKSGAMAGRAVDFPTLVRELEAEGLARMIPTLAELTPLRDEIARSDHRLRSWPERFASLDARGERKTGESLRILSLDRELTKRALLWLQRKHLTAFFPDFDPTSNRDEDLPIDLDHLVPDSRFGFHWKSRDSYIDFPDPDENFRWQRGAVGNSLGNFRWLGSSENRGRGNRSIEPLEDSGDHISEVCAWNALIEKDRWTHGDVAAFQRLIDLRTIKLYEMLLTDGRIASILSETNELFQT